MSKIEYKDNFDGYEYSLLINEDGVRFHRYSTSINGETYDYHNEIFREYVRDGVFVNSGVKRSDALRYAAAAFSRVRDE